jgi:hydrogenase assembly chaperone HypC/HupF
LRDWARQFEGAYPYLALIARANGLSDPLDYRVVEAYWLGNELLAGVDLAAFYDSLRERFAPRLSPKTLHWVLGKAPAGAKPFHAFHVLDVCRRTGALAESLETLDSCRISWGHVQSIENGSLYVAVQPIVFDAGRLALGAAQIQRVMRQIDGRGFVDDDPLGLGLRSIECAPDASTASTYTASSGACQSNLVRRAMCVSFPVQVIQIGSHSAIVSDGQKQFEVGCSLLLDAQAGDWVLVHAGQMVSRITAEEAQAIRELMDEIRGEIPFL